MMKTTTPKGAISMKRYFILGGGIAALSAAQAIRENDPSGLIVMISGENVLPYYRPALTKQLLANISAKDIAIKKPAWFDAPGRDIVTLTGRTVSSIDVETKTVTLADGNVFTWDKLVYALGARCFIPAFEGSNKPSVIAVRDVKDAARVRELARTARHAVVIGGGVLGLEAAWALHQGGLTVSVVEFDARVMARQVDAETSEQIARAMRDHGVKLYTCASAARLDDQGLHLQDGRILPADLVIVSAGIRANAEIAAAAGIRVDRKVIADEHMQTSVPDVYAAGDCAACGVSYGLWLEAKEMGRVAGVNAAGGDAVYQPETPPVHFAGFGLEIKA